MSADRQSMTDDPTKIASAESGPHFNSGRSWVQEWRLPITLFIATCLVTLWTGQTMVEGDSLFDGWTFSVPLMSILLAHEMGHYVTAKIHKVDTSPPFFIPMPMSLLGTMGAVIRMRGEIRSRNALLDIGASGPLAGLLLAVPIVIYGVSTSSVAPLSDGAYIAEGHSLFYKIVIYACHGPIPDGSDIHLTPTALAGWAGLLVTMINLIPFGQLDGGHISYALIGPKQDRVSRAMLRLLPVLALIVSVSFFVPSYLAAEPEYKLIGNALAGVSWLVWWALLLLMTRLGGLEHPPTEDNSLSPKRRAIAMLCLIVFVLLFMPAMARSFAP